MQPLANFARTSLLAALCLAGVGAFTTACHAESDGVVRVRSAYSVPDSVRRIKADIAKKGIRFFAEIDQAKLAHRAGIKVAPSTLLIFGNPPLGTQFLSSKPESGLDWPVRVLVHQDTDGQVWAAWSDFEWIGKRYGIEDREAQLTMADQVVRSIAASVSAR